MQMFWFIFFLVLTLLTIILLLRQVSKIVDGYEEARLAEITQEIEEKNSLKQSIPNIGSRSFSAFDISKSITKGKEIADNLYKKTFQTIRDAEYKEWFGSAGQLVKNLRTRTLETLKKITSYFIKLTKPVNENTLKEIEQKTTGVKVENTGKIAKTESKTIELEAKKSNEKQTKEEKDADSSKPAATLSFASDAANKANPTQFEILEQRIISKLQDRGMDDYQTWLELGQLYSKFDQEVKAKEVFALVLKHGSENAKEKARDQLIALN